MFGWKSRSRRGALTAVLALALVVPLLVSSQAVAEQAASAEYRQAASRIDAGLGHTCVVLGTGQVRCWGAGLKGQLGYGSLQDVGDNEHPGAVGPVSIGRGRTALAVSAGDGHTCVILDNGRVRCWGWNQFGQLGYGHINDIGDNESPASAGPVDLGPGRTAAAITTGGNHTCAILDNGQVRCWGQGTYGRLGLGNTADIGDNETPAAVGPVDLGPGRTAVAITAGNEHTCVVLDNGRVRCWGRNSHGQLGYGHTDIIGDNETPASAGTVQLGPGRTATAVTAGVYTTCVIMDNGQVRCWGAGADGALGYGNPSNVGDNETPASLAPVDLGPGRTAVAINGQGYHTCAVLDTLEVRCWGWNDYGQLGYGHTDAVGNTTHPSSDGPVDLGPGRTARAVAAGNAHTCALLDNGAVRCWGLGGNGQLGYGNTETIGDDETPGTFGPVQLRATLSVRAASKLSVAVKKKRVRKAPYRFVLRSRVSGPFIADAATCTGTVKIVVRKATKPRRNKRVGKASKPLGLKDGQCFVKTKVTTKKKLPGKLTAVVRYRGSTNLDPARKTRALRAG